MTGPTIKHFWARSLAIVLAVVSLAGMAVAKKDTGPADVDAARLLNANAEAGQWLSDGRTYSSQRYSPLTQEAGAYASPSQVSLGNPAP